MRFHLHRTWKTQRICANRQQICSCLGWRQREDWHAKGHVAAIRDDILWVYIPVEAQLTVHFTWGSALGLCYTSMNAKNTHKCLTI